MNSLNKPSPLVLSGDKAANFRTFRNNIDIYFRATKSNYENDETQSAILSNLIGSKALKLYDMLDIDDTDTVETILNKFENYCCPRLNEAMTFYNFFTRNQRTNETFDSFYSSLLCLIKLCNFRSDFDEDRILKSRVVLGIRNIKVQKELLQEEYTLVEMVSHCRRAEAPRQNRKELVQSVKAKKVAPKSKTAKPKRLPAKPKKPDAGKTKPKKTPVKKVAPKKKYGSSIIVQQQNVTQFF